MTLRRYAPMKKSAGTVIPAALRKDVIRRDWSSDGFCVGPRVGMPEACFGAPEIDHVRSSGALGKKSATELGNLVLLCSTHHRLKTLEGRKWRPALLRYLDG